MIVYMHVGAPKTGTTYVQHLLRRNQQALADDGVCYPGERRKSHYWAALDLRETAFKGYRHPNVPGAWPRLVEQIQQWDGHAAIIDHELFCHATHRQIQRALSDLSFAEVHVIYSVRDLARQIPAAWQEKIKNGGTRTFADFLHDVRHDATTGQGFWRSQDFVRVLGHWAEAVPADRIHVVTVPPRGDGHSSLWERFAAAAGLDPDSYETGDLRSNSSLGAAEAGAVRRLNLAANGKDIDWPAYASSVKALLADVLGRRPRRRPITLPAEDYPWVYAHAQESVRKLKDAGYDVVGDPTDLLPPEPSDVRSAAAVDEVSTEEQLDAAGDAMAALLERITTLQQRLERAENRIENLKVMRDRALARAEQAEARRARTPLHRMKRTVVKLGDRVPAVDKALRLYRRGRQLRARR